LSTPRWPRDDGCIISPQHFYLESKVSENVCSDNSSSIVCAVLQSLIDTILQIPPSAAPACRADAASSEPQPPAALLPQQMRVFSADDPMRLDRFVSAQVDPVLKSYMEDISREAVPVMMLRGGGGWLDGYMAVRSGCLVYANTFQAVKRAADSLSRSPTDTSFSDPDLVTIALTHCSVAKRPAETDKAHFAFALTSSEVRLMYLTFSASAAASF
jgi:hypothetical protein